MKEPVSWSKAGPMERQAVCRIVGWRTHKGAITKTGAKIASTSWDSLSAAARNVLLRHGVQP